MQIIIYLTVAAGLFCEAGFILWLRYVNKRQVASIENFRGHAIALQHVVMDLRDIWDHLPRFIPIPEAWGAVARHVGYSLPHLLGHTRRMGKDPSQHEFTEEDFAGCGTRGAFENLSDLVRDINDATLTELWQRRKLIDLVEILRLCLFKTWQPGFDLSPLYVEGRPPIFTRSKR